MLTYIVSIFSAAFGLAKFMKAGVTRTVAPGGPLDGLLGSHFIVCFLACGLVLLSKGSVFGIVTVNYGNSNEIDGRDADDLIQAGVTIINENEILLQQEVLEFLITNNIPDMNSLNKLLVHCDEFGGFKDRINKCLNKSLEASSSRLKRSIEQPSPGCKEGCRYSIFKKRCVRRYQDSDVDCEISDNNMPVHNENVSQNNEVSNVNVTDENVDNGTRTENILKLKTHGSPLEVKLGTVLILYVPQLILALVVVIDVRSGASWRTLMEQPSLILMPVFTHFTFARINLGGCQNDETDNRIMISKFFTIINIVLSIISHVFVFTAAHFLLDSEDWGWHLTGEEASILSQLLASVPLIVSGIIFTMIFLNFCSSCFAEEIVVYDKEHKEKELIFENGKIKLIHNPNPYLNSQDVEMIVVNGESYAHQG